MAMTITTVGLNHILDTELHGGTPVDPWYVGLVDDASWSQFAAADTMASHAGWLENTDYAGDRKAYVEAAADAGVTTNAASPADFVMDASVTIKGAFLVSDASGTAGVLLAEVLFTGGDQAVVDGDTIRVTATVTITSA